MYKKRDVFDPCAFRTQPHMKYHLYLIKYIPDNRKCFFFFSNLDYFENLNEDSPDYKDAQGKNTSTYGSTTYSSCTTYSTSWA